MKFHNAVSQCVVDMHEQQSNEPYQEQSIVDHHSIVPVLVFDFLKEHKTVVDYDADEGRPGHYGHEW